MVVFTCGHCGESVNKPKVEKHYMTKCRNRSPNLSCMDCFKDFFGKAYEEHTKCITEEQRYSAKGFVAKEKKGEQKQSAWVELVQSVLDQEKDAPANVLRILNTISKHNNTPRKKPKFINFVKNVCGHKTHPKDVDAAWDMISVKLAALSTNNKNQNDFQVQKSVENEKNTENVDEKDESSTSDAKLNREIENHDEVVEKKSKKQRKEEKKQKKYKAELESAASAPVEDENEQEQELKPKKGKKKNKGEATTNGDASGDADDTKNKKRKRQDTVNSTASNEVNENGVADLQMQNLQLNGQKTEKTKKKKAKVEQSADESICLHDQNVANGETQEIRSENFNWHAVIISLLEKKDNEMQFKRLQKKVLGEYSEVTGMEVDDRIADKFIKRLRSAPNVKVDGNRVLLVQ